MTTKCIVRRKYGKLHNSEAKLFCNINEIFYLDDNKYYDRAKQKRIN